MMKMVRRNTLYLLIAILFGVLPCGAQEVAVLATHSEVGVEVRLQQAGPVVWLELEVARAESEHAAIPPKVSVTQISQPKRLILDVPLLVDNQKSEAANRPVSMVALEHPLFSQFQATSYQGLLRLELSLRSEAPLRIAKNYMREQQTLKVVFQESIDEGLGRGQTMLQRETIGLPDPDRARTQPPLELAAHVRANSELEESLKEEEPNEEHWNTAAQYIQKVEARRGDTETSLEIADADFDAINHFAYRGYGGLEIERNTEVLGAAVDDEGIDYGHRPGWFERTFSSMRRFVRTHPAIIALLVTVIGLTTLIAGFVFWRTRSVSSKGRKKPRSARPTSSFAEGWYGAGQVQKIKEELYESYSVLGVEPNCSDEAIKSRYKHLVKVFHADKLKSRELPDEVMQLANKQFQRIQTAYELVKEKRNMT